MGNSSSIRCTVCGYEMGVHDALNTIYSGCMLQPPQMAEPSVQVLTAAEANRRELRCPRCGAKGRWEAK
jgi:DNA-directed RNA polymerase subunit RPC12/RpoP